MMADDAPDTYIICPRVDTHIIFNDESPIVALVICIFNAFILSCPFVVVGRYMPRIAQAGRASPCHGMWRRSPYVPAHVCLRSLDGGVMYRIETCRRYYMTANIVLSA